MKRFGIIFSCLVLFGVAIFYGKVLTNAQDDDPTPPRTYYETLDLDTPESAVIEFVSAFQRRDFPTVYLIFSPHAQFIMQQNLNLLRYGELVQVEYEREIAQALPRIGTGEHSLGNMDYVFDQFMLAALERSALLIDLSGKVTILESVESAAESRDEGESVIDVITSIEEIEGDVIFRMEPAPSGRWRVYQVISEGGDEEKVPWSVPPHTIYQASTVWDTSCEDNPPQQSLVDTGEPTIIVDPPCADLGGNRQPPPLTISGINFAPDIPIQIHLAVITNGTETTPTQELATAIPDSDGSFSVEVMPTLRIRAIQTVDIELRAIQRIPNYP